ncbi:MAG: TRAP transporter substrate-binding protein [Xanthomonadales bacterium]|nr:TRAP transporter substrate-binding protein [Xanthomonadales bacterium]
MSCGRRDARDRARNAGVKRRTLLGAALAGASASLLAEPAAAQQLTATDVHPANYPTVLAVQWIGEQLASRSGGRYQLRHYHSGQLGRESDALQSARLGVIDICRLYGGGLNNAFPLTSALCLPYAFDSVEHQRRVLDGPVGAAVLDSFQDRGLIGLAIYDSGARHFYNARRPIRGPQDLQGMKVRVPLSDMFMQLLGLFGANPTPLAYGAVYSALETHLIDGAENNLRSFHASRHFEAARYWSLSGHSYAPDVLLMSQVRFDAMSADDQALLRELARESVGRMRQWWDEGEATARAAIAAAGIETGEVDLAAFRAAAAPLVDDYRRDSRIDALYRQIREAA